MGGGGGGGQPTQSTVTNTNIPEYARPYVETMLGATQQQLFNTQQTPGVYNPETGTTGPGTTEITGVKPYVPYSEDPTAYVAGFSPMQQQAFQGAAGLQVPGQYGAATGATAEAMQRAMGMGYQPGYFGNQFQSPGQYAAGRFSMLEAQAPELQQYQMGPTERVGAGTFTEPGTAGAYMSPYMQNVVDIQQREAQRASNIAAQGQRAQAVGAGAFGGTRQALVEAERQRNLATQMGDIQATGQQAAYQQAQQQFNQEQQARLQAALANQQAGLTVGGQNLQALLGVQQLGAGQNIQAQLANQQALQAAQQAAEQSRQFGYGQAMTGAQQRAQYGLAGQQLGEQSRQYGAGLGLQGLGLGLQGAGQLAGIGGQQLQAQQGILGLQQQYGGQQQAQQQNIINQAIQNYAMAQQYPQQQLAFMNAMLRGLPLQSATTQMYQAAPSMGSQLAGMGTAAYGLGKLGSAFAKGGEVKRYAEGGITSISKDVLLNPEKYSADSIKRLMAEKVIDETVGLPALRTIELERNKMQTAQAMNAPQQPSIKEALMAQAAGAGIDQANINPAMFTGAGGGIVAFASGGDAEDDDDDEIDTEDTKMDKDMDAMLRQLMASYQSRTPPSAMGIGALGSGIRVPTEDRGLGLRMPPAVEEEKGTPGKSEISLTSAKEERSTGLKMPSGHKYERSIVSQAEKLGLDPEFAMKLAMKETGGLKDPEKARSHAGALGIMQLMPGTARDMGVENPLDPEQNIAGGLRYAKMMMDKYQDPKLAAIAYNWGPGNTDKWLRAGADMSKLPKETKNYVANLKKGGIAKFASDGLVGDVPVWADIEGGTSDDVIPRSELVEAMTLQELQEYNRSGRIPPGLREKIGSRKIGAVPLIGETALPSRATAPVFGAPKPTAAQKAEEDKYRGQYEAQDIQEGELGRLSTPASADLAAAAQAAAGEKSAAPTSLIDRLEALLAKREQGLEKQREQDKYMAILAAGLGMMGGTSPHAMANIGAGAMKGVESLSAANKLRAAEENAILSGRLGQYKVGQYEAMRKQMSDEAQMAKFTQQLGATRSNMIKNIVAAKKLDINAMDQSQLSRIEAEADAMLARDPAYQAMYKRIYGEAFSPARMAVPSVDYAKTYGLTPRKQ